MESEPASEKDQALLARAPHLVLDGAELAAEAVGADVVHVCLPRTRPLAGRQVSRRGRRAAAGRDRRGTPVQRARTAARTTSPARRPRWSTGSTAARPGRPAGRRGRSSAACGGARRSSTTSRRSPTSRSSPASARPGSGRPGCADAPGTMLATVSGAVDAPGRLRDRGRHADRRRAGLEPASGRAPATVLVGGYFGTWHDLRAVAGLPMSAARPAARSAPRPARACWSPCRRGRVRPGRDRPGPRLPGRPERRAVRPVRRSACPRSPRTSRSSRRTAGRGRAGAAGAQARRAPRPRCLPSPGRRGPAGQARR